MTGTVRVYASDSASAAVIMDIGDYSYSYDLSYEYRRGTTNSAYAEYDLTYSNKSIPAPMEDSARGVRVFFDFLKVPVLQGRVVKKITGPYMYLRHKYTQLGIYSGGTPLSFKGFTFEDVLLRFLIREPSDATKVEENHLGLQQTGQYFNVRIHGQDQIKMFDDAQWSDIFVCASAWKGVLGERYWGEVSATFDSATGEHPPYIDVEYATGTEILIKDCSPKSGFADEKAPVQLSWRLLATSLHAIGYAVQKSANIQWRKAGTDTIHNIAVSGATSAYTVPANTFPNGTIEWRVSAVSRDDDASPYSDWNAFSTEDNETSAPTGLSPSGEMLDGASPILLSWQHNSPLNTAPTAFEVQVDLETGSGWRPLSGKITSDQSSYTVPADTLPSGNVRWRVRDYNSDGLASQWSEPAAVLIRAAPRIPDITSVTSLPKPVVQWFVSGQQAYQLQVGEWDSGVVFGATRQAQVTEFLPDGPAVVRLRVQNNFGLWSEWATATVTIRNTPGQAITVNDRATKTDLILSWQCDEDYAQYIIYRDGEQIGSATNKEFIDHMANGKASYSVRGVRADSTYTDSAPTVGILRLRMGYIAAAGEWEWLALRCLRGKYPGVETSERADIAYTHYSGRALPVAEYSEHRTRQHALSFTLRERKELMQLRGMVGKHVVYKDLWERVITGMLDELSVASDWAADVSFTITEVDDGAAV